MAATRPTSPTLADPRPAAAPRAGGRLAVGLRRLRRLAGLLAVVALGAVLCVYFTLWRWLRRRRHPRLPGVARWWEGRVCRALGVSVRLAAGRPATPALLVANHVSWLDIVALGSLTPMAFVSKAEVRGWPVIGWLAAVGGTLFIPRGAHQAGAIAQAIRERLARGESIVIFPEGTTTDGSRLRPFFPRLFAAAVEADATVQPAAVAYPWQGGVHPAAPFIGDETFASHLWRVLAEPGIEVEVRFCDPLAAAAADRRGLAQRARAAIAAALGLPAEPA